ncbi:hypothetical protein Tco_0025632 [Tanacetum coccineum]
MDKSILGRESGVLMRNSNDNDRKCVSMISRGNNGRQLEDCLNEHLMNGWGLAFGGCGDRVIVIGGLRTSGAGFIVVNSWFPSAFKSPLQLPSSSTQYADCIRMDFEDNIFHVASTQNSPSNLQEDNQTVKANEKVRTKVCTISGALLAVLVQGFGEWS